MATDYLIWSHEHGAWWKPARWGYTHDVTKAGRYSESEAQGICDNANWSWLRGNIPPHGDLPAEVMIAVPVEGESGEEIMRRVAAVTAVEKADRDTALGAAR